MPERMGQGAARRSVVPIALLVVFSCGFLASAASYIKTTLRDMTQTAVAVAEVEVGGKAYPEMLPGQTFPRTHIAAKVVRTLKGDLPAEITLDIPGGIHGDIASYVPDGADFKTGERAMVFMKKPADLPEGRFMVQDLGLGKFNIVERDGKRFVESALCARALEAGKNDAEAELLTRSIPYDQFCELITSYVAGTASKTDAAALAATLPASTAHGHNAVPAVLADARALQEASASHRALWMMGLSVLGVAIVAFVWVRQRRKLGAKPMQARSIVLVLSGAMLAGAGLSAGCKAFVQFDQKTIWNLDKPSNGKIAGNRIIWKQSTAVSVTNGGVFSGVQQAFNTWEAVGGSRLAFTAGGSTNTTTNNSQDTENVIAWSTTPTNDFSKNTLAITFSSFSVGTSSNFIDGDIIFNDRDFSWAPGAAGNVVSVALHEIGHFVGLNHTTDKNTVMFPFDSGFTALKPDEVVAAQTLYPGADGGPAATGGPVVTAGGSPLTGLPPLAVSFTGSAVPGAAGDPVTSLQWDFGDGQTATTGNVSHTYTTPGTFTATLTATDAVGGTGTSTVIVNVGEEGSPTKAAFKLNFASLGKDSFSVTIASQQLVGFKDARGAGSVSKGYINIGDQSWQFDFDTEKGKSVQRDGPKISVNSKSGTVSATLKNADLRDVLGGHGAVNDDIIGGEVKVPVVIWFGESTNKFIFGRISFSYSAKADKSGAGKF